MARRAGIFLAALLLAACASTAFSQDEIEDVEDIDEEKAFLVTRKSIADKELVVGKNLTVLVEVHNAGTSSALDVEVEDVPWPPQQFDFAGGSPKASFARIPAGTTSKFTYHITPLAAGFYSAHPATATYRDTPDASEPVVAKSSAPHLYILTPTQKYIKLAITVGSYATLGSMRTVAEWRNAGILLAIVAVSLVGHRSYKSITAARKRSQYQRALEEVNKYE